MRGTHTALSPASDKVFPDGALAVAGFAVAFFFVIPGRARNDGVRIAQFAAVLFFALGN